MNSMQKQADSTITQIVLTFIIHIVIDAFDVVFVKFFLFFHVMPHAYIVIIKQVNTFEWSIAFLAFAFNFFFVNSFLFCISRGRLNRSGSAFQAIVLV